MGYDKQPRVSIGLAVYNGERYLEEAILSILRQTYRDFELIISDNASTDGTQAISFKYAAQDPRIRYHRNPANIGGANNENQTFRMSKGEYFRWAAHDDLCAPELIEKCVAMLDQNPSVVLCHSIIVEIDEVGNVLKTTSRKKAQSNQPHKRFRELTRLDHNCEETYGLIRASILRQTRLQLNYTDSDRTLLAQLSLYGKFYQIPEPLFYKRYHPGMSTQVYPEWRGRMDWFGPSEKGQLALPYWMQYLHYLQIIAAAPIPASEKLGCYLHMVEWVLRYKRWKGVALDLLLAARGLLHT